MKQHNARGQYLIEVLIALSVFMLFIVGAMLAIGRYSNASLRSVEFTDATQLVKESFAAIRAIGYSNWTTLANGNYGLTATSGTWQLQNGPDTTKNKYIRTITIASVERDNNCVIVPSGGLADPDTKKITLTLAWNATPVNQTKTFTEYVTRWRAPTTCFANQTEAAKLVVDVSASRVDSTKKSLVDTQLRNTSTVPITIDKMTLTWTVPGNITYIKINGTNYWHSTNGIGTPQGAQPSGTTLDLVNVVIPANTSYAVNVFRFDSKIDGSTVTITVTMLDGSSVTKVTTPPFIP